MRPLTSCVIATLMSCSGNRPPEMMNPNGIGPFRGLRAVPRQLAFTCVTPGCDTTLTVKVQSTVNRRVAIKRVVPSKDTNEYTLVPSQSAPFILGAAGEFGIDVRFTPQAAPAADDLRVLVTYTDASPNADDPDRLEPGEVEIPLIRRLVGEPVLEVRPGTLSFGLVPQGTTKELPVTVRNAGFGNIALAVDQLDAGYPWLSVGLPGPLGLVPDAGVELPVRFAPLTRGYFTGSVTIGSSTPAVNPVAFEVEGTSFVDGIIALEPEERAIDFGEVPRRQKRSVTVRVANLGGKPLFLSAVTVKDMSNNVRASLPNSAQSLTLDPLQRVPLTIDLDAATPGVINATLVVTSTDLMRTNLEVPIRGTVTEPRLTVSPTMLSWGNTPLGWSVSKPLELRNTGFGTLSIKRLIFVGGTSNLFSLQNAPALPATIATAGRTSFEVEFRSETISSFSGALSIESDDPVNTIVTIPLSAIGVSCNTGCQVANATPSCMNGICGIASCNAGYFNTDGMPSNGCECRDLGQDPSPFCGMATYKGILKDSGATAQQIGMLPTNEDVDWVSFFAEDEFKLFDEDFDVRVTLTSPDPNIVMCVYRQETSSRQGVCAMAEEQCNLRSYRKNGAGASSDSADFDIKVYRRANTPATCSQYTLSLSNG